MSPKSSPGVIAALLFFSEFFGGSVRECHRKSEEVRCFSRGLPMTFCDILRRNRQIIWKKRAAITPGLYFGDISSYKGNVTNVIFVFLIFS